MIGPAIRLAREGFGVSELIAHYWGISVPLAVPRAAQEMKRRGSDPGQIDKVIYQNPIEFMSQSPRFTAPEGL